MTAETTMAELLDRYEALRQRNKALREQLAAAESRAGRAAVAAWRAQAHERWWRSRYHTLRRLFYEVDQ